MSVYTPQTPQLMIRELHWQGPEGDQLEQLLLHDPGSREYTKRVTGLPSQSDGAAKLRSALPPGKTYEDKFVFGIFAGDKLIGCIDLVRGYPDAETAYLGLLFVAEHMQRHRVGTQAVESIAERCRSWPGVTRIRGAVVETNSEVLHFWERCGFRMTGEMRPYESGMVRAQSILLERVL